MKNVLACLNAMKGESSLVNLKKESAFIFSFLLELYSVFVNTLTVRSCINFLHSIIEPYYNVGTSKLHYVLSFSPTKNHGGTIFNRINSTWEKEYLKISSKQYFLFFSFLFLLPSVYSQSVVLPPIGAQVDLGGGCYNLTPNCPTAQRGALWSTSTVNFNNPFVIKFDARVDMASGLGADGFVVVFGENFTTGTPPHNTAGELGYYGTTNPDYTNNSFAIEFDTYDNGVATEIANDHIAICQNASFTSMVAGPASINGIWGIKDDSTRTYTIKWNPSTTTLNVYMGESPCVPILTSTFDLRTVFSSWALSNIQWGITSGTGGSCSNHIICNVNPPIPSTNVYQTICSGTTATISAPPGFPSYSWSTGAITSSITVGAGTYSVAATSACEEVHRIFHITTTEPTITGITHLCVGQTTTLSSPSGSGTWASSNVSVATIGSSTGLVTGVGTGTSTITFTQASNGCIKTVTFTVNPLPAIITGPSVLCVGSSITLSNSSGSGTWVSGNLSIATVGSTTGTVTGISAGTTTITYAFPSTGCMTVKTVTVNAQPAVISGSTFVCQGETIVLSNATSGGTWSSGNPAVATVGLTTGVVTGVSGGTATISYTITLTGCSRTIVVTVGPTPEISDTFVCVGSSIVLTASPSGGTWVSSSPSIAGVGSSTGLVIGHTVGTSIITYTDFLGCVSTSVFTVNPLPAPIAGVDLLCQGYTLTLTDATPGGTWSSSNTSVATVGSSTGVVTGISDGSTIITYKIAATGCFQYVSLTVLGMPTYITGDTSLCLGSSGTLVAPGATVGFWSSSNPGVASVGSLSGVVTSLSVGTSIVTFSFVSMWCNVTVTKIVTVYPVPGIITGTLHVCEGDVTTLSNSVGGGIWTSSDISIATIGSSSGIVTGISPGIVNITYTLGGVCSEVISFEVDVVPTSIVGALICTGSDVILSSSPWGGVWSSSDVSVGTIASVTGVMTGIAPGTTSITYTLGTGCYTSTVVTVYESPSAIIGILAICNGETTLLGVTPSGGTWSSGTPGVATIDISGLVSSVSTGTSSITYTVGNGCTANAVVTVNPVPVITGDTIVCTEVPEILATSISGGIWTCAPPAIASIDPSSGTLTGHSAGTTIITYTLSTGCNATMVVTVYTSPAAIAGDFSICKDETTVLSNSVPGGAWSSTVPGVATIATDGTVTGIAAGTSVISYTMPGDCVATVTVVVNPLPNLSGDSVICTGDVVTLTSDLSGTWSSSVPLVASIGSTSGILIGIASGTTIITFTTDSGCTAIKNVTVNETPAAIVGPFEVCHGFSIVLTESTLGGTWSSGTPAVATIGTDGTVTGVSPGTSIISYTVASGCFDTAIITVHPLPTLIDGTFEVCVNDSVLFIGSPVGGMWTSADVSIATVNPGTGYVTGVLPGTTVISYTLPTGCYLTTTITVNPLPSPILGPSSVCQEFVIYLSDTTAGGIWTGSSPGVALFDPMTGAVTGISPGTIAITYTLISTGCRITHIVTVHPVPDGIAGDLNICDGASGMLTCSPMGGTWTSVSTGVVTIDPITGAVFGVSVGSSQITYMLPTGCYQLGTVNVFPVPTAITGIPQLCIGDTATLSSTPTGGYWVTDAPWIANIDAITGLWTAYSGGTATITYIADMAAGCSTTLVVTVGPIVGPLTFSDTDDTLCIGDTTTIGHPTAGGVWDISDYSIASWVPSGANDIIITGLSSGTVTISYSVTDTCGTTTVTRTIHVIGIPRPSITGVLGVCDGYTTTLTGTPPGGTWVSSDPAIASIDAAGVVTGIIGGGTVTIIYTATNVCGSDFTTTNVLVNMEPYITTNFIVACQSLSGVPDNPYTVISGHSECIKVCDSSIVRYYANGVEGSAFTWDIYGGTVITDYGDSIDVLWSTVGLTGAIVLHDTFHHCIDSAAACIKVIDRPDALFSTIDTNFCLGANIVFTDLSTGDPSSPIVYWHWDFGDGTVIPSASSATVEHDYDAAGTYTVTLTVRNQCNCTDSFKKVVRISKFKSPVIVCPAIVCDSEYAVYRTKGNCTDFIWTVKGGTYFFDTSTGGSPGGVTPVILDSTGTILTEGTGTVTIHWDHVDSTGFGYLTLYTPGCSLCESPTTLKIPVILQHPDIEGLDTICTSTQVAYSLPLWPATSYIWSVLDNPFVIPLCHEDHKVVVEFPAAGTYTLHGTYQNKIKLCGGDVFKVITVLPPSAILGPLTICLGSTETYSLSGGYSADWEVVDPVTETILATATGATSFPYLFGATGTFIIRATGDFCLEPITVRVINIPPPVDTIIGPERICLRRPYTYKALNNVPGTIFSWQAIGGTVVPVSGVNTVTVDWTSPGVKQLRVRRVSVAPPFCPGPWLTIDINHEIVNPDVSGNIIPCANSSESYSANYSIGEAYEWTILPNTSGSVISGLHAANATILWNNVAGISTASVVVTVRKCDSIKTDTLEVTISGGPPIALLSVSDDTVCGRQSVGFAVTSGGAAYDWDFGDGWFGVTATSHTTHRFPKNYTSSYIAYTVQVTSAGGCASPVGTVTAVVYVKPGINVSISPVSYSPCVGDTIDLYATTSSNVPLASITWYGSVPPIYLSSGHTLIYASTTISAVAIDSNGCSDTSSIFIPFYSCDTTSGYCTIPTTITSVCNTMTLLAGTPGSPAPGYWRPVDHTVVPTYGNPATAVFPAAGIYTFYFVDTVTHCRSATQAGKIYATSDFVSSVQCSTTPGMYDIHLKSLCTYLPEVTGVGLTWIDATPPLPDPVIPTATPYTVYTVPASSTVDIGLTIDGTITGGTVSCYSTRTITVPAALSVAYTYTVSPICERLPVFFTPVVTGTGLSYYWDFDDGSSLLLGYGKREFTWQGASVPDNRFVKFKVKDKAGCMDSVSHLVEIYPNTLRGNLGPDTTVCSDVAPYTLLYDPAPGSPTPISYLWSTAEITPTINVTESGSFWVTVTGLWQCTATMPEDSAVNVRIVQTPPAIIRGPRHYCAGDEINLNGYAGDDILYQWYVDGVATTAPGNYPTKSWISPEDTFTIQLLLKIYDSVTGRYCDVYSAIDTIMVYPLPAPPLVSGPHIVDCDLYKLKLIASAPESGIFNWIGFPSGPVIDIKEGGPYRVWFTDLRGCASTTTVYVPFDPNTYKPYFPNGCYDVCTGQLPLTLYGPPCASFDSWSWNDGYGTLSSGIDEMDSLDITGDEGYYWKLHNGLCGRRIGLMDLTTIRCNKCQGVSLGAVVNCEPDSPSSYSIDVTFNTNYPVMTYVLGTDIGPITPFMGTVVGAGPHTASLEFTTMERNPLPDSVTVQLILTTTDGVRCYEEVTIMLDSCSWVLADRGSSATDIVPHTPAGRQANATAMLVFPNPASSIVTIQYDYGYGQGSGRSLVVYDVMGRKVNHTIPEGERGTWQLDATQWTPGIYVVRMEGDGNLLHSQQMVITH